VRPYDADLRYNLGNALLAAGNIESARSALVEALKLDPAHARARQKMSQDEPARRVSDLIKCSWSSSTSLNAAPLWRA
jgi:Flp pilus assembly protein TadD